MKKITLTLLLILAFVPAALAKQYEFQHILISNLWARPTAEKMGNSAIYLEIKNQGKKGDALIKAETDIATNVEIHKTVDNNGISSMVQLSKVSIPANTTVQFTPGGLHIMILGVTSQLKDGDSFPLMLTFEHAGKIDVEVVVKK